jgi:hypothetical protein
MKALTLHQPWASLIAEGVKTIETRSWSTKYRGPLAIHAAARRPDVEMLEDGLAGEIWNDDDCLVQWAQTEATDFYQPAPPPGDRWWLSAAPTFTPVCMPLGAVVATCTLVDVVPMVEEIPPQSEWRDSWSCLTCEPWPILNTWPGFGSANGRCVSDQLPYGDFSPGRFAWLLADIVKLDGPVDVKGKQGLWEWER